jgi:DNA-binding MarR family transcriptional regulator
MDADLARTLTREVMTTADTFLRESARLFRPHGITAAQYNVISVLAAAPEGLSQRVLGDALVVDRSNVTGLINRLAEAGYVARKVQPEDRRAHRVVLTVAGRRLWEKVCPHYESIVLQVVAGISKKRAGETLAVLQAMQAHATTWKLAKK